jgi:hypothetical protein
MTVDFDTASPDELMRESREMQRKAAATGDTYRWAADQQAADRARFTPIPLGAGDIDLEEMKLARRRAEARKTLDNALTESGLTERWRKTEALAEYFSSLEGSGALGRLMSGKVDNPELHAADIDQRKGKRS